MASKNIVMCFDGTGNKYGKNNTNVVLAFQHIIKQAAREPAQIAYYDPGIGTFSILGQTPVAKWIGKILGLAFGYGLKQNLDDAQEFLMNHYRPGDRIYVFGFSRGAFTARAFAGMLEKIGLLKASSRNLLRYATEMYLGENDQDIIEGFKKTFSDDCRTHCIAVWDTVGSLGWFFNRTLGHFFSDNILNPNVKFAYHAMALDERREKFPVTPWDESQKAPGQVIEQVWFAGVHSDVGGWYEERGLSDIAAVWMLKKAAIAGLQLEDRWQGYFHPDPKGEQHESLTWLWRMLYRIRPRSVKEGDRIHRSVIERGSQTEYQPHAFMPEDWPASLEIVD